MCSVQCARNSIATSSSTSKTCQVGKERNVPEFDIVHGKKVGSSTWEESLSLEVAEEEVSQNCTVRGRFYFSPPANWPPGFMIHITWTLRVQHFWSFLPCVLHSAPRWLKEMIIGADLLLGNGLQKVSGQCCAPCQRRRRGGWDIPQVLSGPGEITSDVIGSSIFCNRTQKGSALAWVFLAPLDHHQGRKINK